MSCQLRAERLQARAAMQAAAAAGQAACAQLTDELPASCLGSLLALLLAQVRSEHAGRARSHDTCRLECQQRTHMLILALRTGSIAGRNQRWKGSDLHSISFLTDACAHGAVGARRRLRERAQGAPSHRGRARRAARAGGAGRGGRGCGASKFGGCRGREGG